MKKFLLVAAICCFATSAIVGSAMVIPSPAIPMSKPKPAWTDDTISIFNPSSGIAIVSSTTPTYAIMNAVGTIGYTVHNGVIDQNCHPLRDPRELMAANETPEQIAARNMPREQLAAAKE